MFFPQFLPFYSKVLPDNWGGRVAEQHNGGQRAQVVRCGGGGECGGGSRQRRPIRLLRVRASFAKKNVIKFLKNVKNAINLF